MATYFTDDFADFGTDWTERYNTTPTWSVSSGDLTIPTGAASDWCAVTWNDIDGDADRDDVEALILVTLPAATLYPIILRASGADESASLYTLRLATTSLRTYYCNGSDTPTQIGSSGASLTVGVDYWVRFRVNGTSIRLRVWADGGSEPGTWNTDSTDSTVSGVGWSGLSIYTNSGAGATIKQVGFGTNGDTAPSAAGGGSDATVTLPSAAAASAPGTISAAGGAAVTLTGAAATAQAGTLTATGGATAAIVGASTTAAAGTLTATGGAVVALVGASATAAAGIISASASGSASVTLPSALATAAPGAVRATGSATVTLTGAAAVAAAGDITVSLAGDVSVTPQGASAAAAAGAISATAGAVVVLPGASATAYAGTISAVGDVVPASEYIRLFSRITPAVVMPSAIGPTVARSSPVAVRRDLRSTIDLESP